MNRALYVEGRPADLRPAPLPADTMAFLGELAAMCRKEASEAQQAMLSGDQTE